MHPNIIKNWEDPNILKDEHLSLKIQGSTLTAAIYLKITMDPYIIKDEHRS